MVVNHWCNAQFVLNRVCLRMGCTSQMAIFNGENDDIHWNWSFCSFPMDKPGNCYPIHEGTHHQTQKGPQPLCTFMRYLQFVAYLCFGCLLSEFYGSILQFFFVCALFFCWWNPTFVNSPSVHIKPHLPSWFRELSHKKVHRFLPGYQYPSMGETYPVPSGND